MPSWSVLRKPTPDQTWNRVRRDRQTGIPGRMFDITHAPNRDDLEAWAIQIGHPPAAYIRAWEQQEAEVVQPEARQEVIA